jgi:hypothetical protein
MTDACPSCTGSGISVAVVKRYVAVQHEELVPFLAVAPGPARPRKGRVPAIGVMRVPLPDVGEPDWPASLPSVLHPARVRQHQRALAEMSDAGVHDPRSLAAQLCGTAVPATPAYMELLFPGPNDRVLAASLVGDRQPEEGWSIATDAAGWVIDRTHDSLHLLAGRCSGLAASVGSLVGTILLVDARGLVCGSSSTAIGAVMLCPQPRWGPKRWLACLVHEMVHQALFLEEMVHGAYAMSNDAMSETEHRVMSAIRKQPRPYHAAFHAAYVAYVLEWMHDRLGLAGPPADNTMPLAPIVAELGERRRCLTAHGERLLDELASLSGRPPD